MKMMEFIKEWLPLITSGLMLAFGAAIWALFRKVLKSFDVFLGKQAPKLDRWSEQYMGDENSNEMWRQIRSAGESLVKISDKMIATDSFQKNADTDSPQTSGPVTDLSGKLSKSD